MPGFITHYICGEAVLRTIVPELQVICKEYRQLYNIGAQGPDIFFYYLPGLIRKHTKGLGIKMHKNNFGLFMEQMSMALPKIKNPNERHAAIAYLCGYLTHYALDVNAHPYIYYKTGFRRENEPIKGLKFSVYHRNFETAIDTAMLKLVSGEKPSDKKLWQLVHITKQEAAFVTKLISHSIQNAYDVPITEKEVYKSMAYMTVLMRLMQSKHGRRKKLMEFVEDMTVGGYICSSLIHTQELSDEIDYLNTKKAPWKMPHDDTKEHTKSFLEMFDYSCAEAKEMLNALYYYCKEELSHQKMLERVGDFSLKTGGEGKKDLQFMFHDIVFEKSHVGV